MPYKFSLTLQRRDPQSACASTLAKVDLNSKRPTKGQSHGSPKPMRKLLLLLSTVATMAAFAADTVVDSEENPIAAADFEEKIEAGIVVLRQTAPLSVEDAIMLVRVSNTLFLMDGKKAKREEEFGKLMWGRALVERLAQALGESIPNRGMGLFFKRHDLHWGGASGNIRDRDRYTIVEQMKKEEANRHLRATAPSEGFRPTTKRPC